MGSRDDWFRRSSWTNEDQQDFERRLERARPRSRPKYLRIQALHLFETGDPELLPAAIHLTDRALDDHPEHILARGFIRCEREAALALEAAASTHSGFRYHPNVGLVEDSTDQLRLRLAALAAG